VIELTRFDDTKFVLNCDVIQYVEAAPDTIVSLTTKEKLMVKESVEDVIDAVVEFKRRIYRGDLEFRRPEDGQIVE